MPRSITNWILVISTVISLRNIRRRRVGTYFLGRFTGTNNCHLTELLNAAHGSNDNHLLEQTNLPQRMELIQTGDETVSAQHACVTTI